MHSKKAPRSRPASQNRITRFASLIHPAGTRLPFHSSGQMSCMNKTSPVWLVWRGRWRDPESWELKFVLVWNLDPWSWGIPEAMPKTPP